MFASAVAFPLPAKLEDKVTPESVWSFITKSFSLYTFTTPSPVTAKLILTLLLGILTPSVKFTVAITLVPLWAKLTLSTYEPVALFATLKSLAVNVLPELGVIVICILELVLCISVDGVTSKVKALEVVLATPVSVTVTTLSSGVTSPDKLPINLPMPCTLNSWLSKLVKLVASPLIKL